MVRRPCLGEVDVYVKRQGAGPGGHRRERRNREKRTEDLGRAQEAWSWRSTPLAVCPSPLSPGKCLAQPVHPESQMVMCLRMMSLKSIEECIEVGGEESGGKKMQNLS